jgi:tetratricopeptide (TPR) repeat protein
VSGQERAAPEHVFAAYQEELSRGHQALARGDPKGALKAYRAAADLAVDRPLPHVLAGRTLLRINRAADSLAAFQHALDLAPESVEALEGSAEALLRLGRVDDAADAQRRLALARAAADGGAVRASIKGPLPRAEMLAIAAEHAARGGRTEAATGEWLAAARAYAADGHVDAALDACHQALLLEPGSAAAHLEMHRLYVAGGLTTQAAERLDRLTRLAELSDDEQLRAQVADLADATAAPQSDDEPPPA